ncbi:alpha/beta hydrolase [Inhella proteolytica]|uniref:Alpha/beta hydrolase n=1 Tax=Inhella proteolytica TaxID=2795029 RepID=A0A931NKE5_9BURK|nr:alpha/beta hydrolase-fold protein [Inhella proteolytica]MBH9579620.1 alpha/beta hydrolase [Inhella proteolytica]
MMRRQALIGAATWLAGAPCGATAAPSERTSRPGRIERLELPPGPALDPRPVDVWLPPGYRADRPHAVLYMHDGQMLFDPRGTWNQQAWQVDAVAAPLIASGALRDFIVVGIWNAGAARHAEYFPQGFLPHLPAPLREQLVAERLQGRPRSDAYLRFLVETLKPAVDARYATAPGRESTFLMGSSMGGLISCYGLCEYPEVFGGAACLSTHWIGHFERNPEVPAAALAYLDQKLPAPARVKLWMDRGDQELDAKYDDAQARVDALMAAKGFRAPGFVSRVYPGTGHNETAWSARLAEPLRFLLGR